MLRAHPALAAALTSELIGLRVLRVFSVGKELFAVFESRKQIEVEDQEPGRKGSAPEAASVDDISNHKASKNLEALRMHPGESGGYVIEDYRTPGRAWGPKAREKEGPETQLEFNNLSLALNTGPVEIQSHLESVCREDFPCGTVWAAAASAVALRTLRQWRC